MTSIKDHSGNKYIRTIQGRFKDDPDTRVDVYCVVDAFEVEAGPIDHAIKKLLCAGLRGKGDKMQDLVESRDAISRAIEMEERRSAPQAAEEQKPAPGQDHVNCTGCGVASLEPFAPIRMRKFGWRKDELGWLCAKCARKEENDE